MDRIDVLAELSYIDAIISFGEKSSDNDTPVALLKQIQPDFFIKGSDYDVENMTGAKEVRAYGGKVKVMHYQENYSTTKQINKIRTNKHNKHNNTIKTDEYRKYNWQYTTG